MLQMYVVWSVSVRIGHTNVLCKNGRTDGDAVWFIDQCWPEDHVKRRCTCGATWKIRLTNGGDAAGLSVPLVFVSYKRPVFSSVAAM